MLTSSTNDNLLPLCVDLDDTLVMGDTVLFSIKKLLLQKPWLLPVLLFHFIKGGRPAAKAWVAEVAPIDASALPYRADLVEYLRSEKAKGRKIYLVTAATQDTANRIAAHVTLFDAAYGSSETYNLKGGNKAEFIMRNISPRFVYAGDSLTDLLVWKHAEAAILCGKKAASIRPFLNRAVEKVFDQDLHTAPHAP